MYLSSNLTSGYSTVIRYRSASRTYRRVRNAFKSSKTPPSISDLNRVFTQMGAQWTASFHLQVSNWHNLHPNIVIEERFYDEGESFVKTEIDSDGERVAVGAKTTPKKKGKKAVAAVSSPNGLPLTEADHPYLWALSGAEVALVLKHRGDI
jgi:hypothetical protein